MKSGNFSAQATTGTRRRTVRRQTITPALEAMQSQQPVAIYPASIFISYSHADAEIAKRLRDGLKAVDFRALRTATGVPQGPDGDSFRVWEFADSLPVGDQLDSNVESQIRAADVFMIILPRAEHVSPWLQRELGLVCAQRKKTNMRHPRIVPVLAHPGVPMTMAQLDFHSGALTGESFDFATVRCFALGSPGTDSFDRLTQSLLLKAYCFGSNSNDPNLIQRGPDGAFNCYEGLFPELKERDQPRDIMRWLNMAYSRDKSATFLSLFLTLQLGDVCIGIAFLQLDRKSDWIFGAYFGIRAEWRGDGRARRFMNTVIAQCLRLLPDAKGIVFEVEPYRDRQVRSVLKKFRCAPSESPGVVQLSWRESAAVRSVKRIALFTRQRPSALAVTFPDRSLIPYRQPAMKLPLSQANEVPLWLMVLPLGLRPVASGEHHIEYRLDIRELVDFLYDVMFSEAYVRDPETALDGFEPYVREIKQRVLQAIGDREVRLMHAPTLSPDARNLLTKWEHLIEDLGIML
jgi:hypothetical protein